MRKPVVALMAGLAIVAATNNATSEPAQPYTPSLVEFMMNVKAITRNFGSPASGAIGTWPIIRSMN
jgi:hypothetical protein